jgi:hypothetical protein
MNGDLADRFLPAPKPTQVDMSVADEVCGVRTRIFQALGRVLFSLLGRPGKNRKKEKNEEQAKDEESTYTLQAHNFTFLSYIRKGVVVITSPGNDAPGVAFPWTRT